MYCKYLKKEIHYNTFLYNLKNNIKIKNFYINLLPNDVSNEYTKANNISINSGDKYLYSFASGRKLYCKYTGKLISFDRLLRGCITLNDSITKLGKGHLKGKTRKAVGRKISKSLTGKPKSQIHRDKMNERLKSIEFKKTVLRNKNIEFTDDTDVLKKYRDFYSENRKGHKYKFDFCKRNVITYKNYIEFNDDIDTLSESSVNDLYLELMSIKSTIAMLNNKTMGIGKTYDLDDLKFNLSNINKITVRSGLEKKIIDFLEFNKIYWDYETVKIKYFYKFNRLYIIDFLLKINDEIIPLEVKGSFKKEDIDKNIEKISAAMNMYGKIILYQKEPIIDINELLELMIISKNEIIFKHAY